ncbi:hypothetical protein HDV00_006131 [Rhizophlyctis rosea]|nr:hypothetical protein HDV00_006131 [Rhizophlyctis rosea]
MPPKYIDPVKTGLIGSIIIFPLSIVLINVLQRTPGRCYAQACAENENYKTANLVTTYVFYAFLLLTAALLKLANHLQWSHRNIGVGAWKWTYTTAMVFVLVVGLQAFNFGYYWMEVVKLRTTPVRTWQDYCGMFFRVGARTLAYQIALTLLPISRNSFLSTYLRLDYDTTLAFHRWSGALSMFWVLVHVVAHELPLWVAETAHEYFAVLFGLETDKAHPSFGSPMLYLCFPGLLMYILDAFIRVYNRRFQYRLQNVTLEKSGYVRLDIDGTRFKYAPGQWVQIKIPAISRVMWHPFTIASSPYATPDLHLHTFPTDDPSHPVKPTSSHKFKSQTDAPDVTLTLVPSTTPTTLSLLIRPSPRSSSWTNGLLSTWNRQAGSESGRAELEVFVDGPFGVLPDGLLSSDHIVCIAGGSGIPGALSITSATLDKAFAGLETSPSVSLCWTAHEDDITSLSLLQSLQSHPAARDFLDLTIHDSKVEGRIRVEEYIRSLGCWDGKDIESVGVYTCGPAGLTAAVKEAFVKVGREKGVRVVVHCEGYQR